MLKPSLQLKIGQQLTMTPQLQQAIRLLQLPVIDLQSEIQEALEENVMLEAVEESMEQGGTEASPEEESAAEARRASEVEVTWGDTATLPIPETNWSSNSGPRSSEHRGPVSQDFAPRAGQTLQEHLLWQLQMERFDQREFAIGRAIIDAMVKDGAIDTRPGDDDPGAIALMHRLSQKSRERWPEWAQPAARVGIPSTT